MSWSVWCFDSDDHRSELTITDEQLKMNDCYYDKKDWRACRKEVSVSLLNPNQRAKMPRVLGSSPCFGQSTDAWCRWNFSGNAGSEMETSRGLKVKTPSSCKPTLPPSQMLDVFDRIERHGEGDHGVWRRSPRGWPGISSPARATRLYTFNNQPHRPLRL